MTTEMPDDRLMTTTEAAAFLGVTDRHLYNLREKELLDVEYVKTHVYYVRASVEALKAARDHRAAQLAAYHQAVLDGIR